MEKYVRLANIADYFFFHPPEQENEVPLRFRIPNPAWTPPTTDFHPSSELVAWREALTTSLNETRDSVPRPPRSRWHSQIELLAKTHDVVFVDTDKNLDLAAVPTATYVAACEARLAATTVRVDESPYRAAAALGSSMASHASDSWLPSPGAAAAPDASPPGICPACTALVPGGVSTPRRAGKCYACLQSGGGAPRPPLDTSPTSRCPDAISRDAPSQSPEPAAHGHIASGLSTQAPRRSFWPAPSLTLALLYPPRPSYPRLDHVIHLAGADLDAALGAHDRDEVRRFRQAFHALQHRRGALTRGGQRAWDAAGCTNLLRATPHWLHNEAREYLFAFTASVGLDGPLNFPDVEPSALHPWMKDPGLWSPEVQRDMRFFALRREVKHGVRPFQRLLLAAICSRGARGPVCAVQPCSCCWLHRSLCPSLRLPFDICEMIKDRLDDDDPDVCDARVGRARPRPGLWTAPAHADSCDLAPNEPSHPSSCLRPAYLAVPAVPILPFVGRDSWTPRHRWDQWQDFRNNDVMTGAPFDFHWPHTPLPTWEPPARNHHSLDATINFQDFHFEAVAHVNGEAAPTARPFDAVRHAAGVAIELAQKPVFEEFFRMDLTHCTASRSPFDYFNNEERVAIELKSRSCSKATYATTILPSEKVHRLLRMAREGWRVFAAFALDDCILYIQLHQDHNDSWGHVWSAHNVAHRSIPVTSLLELAATNDHPLSFVRPAFDLETAILKDVRWRLQHLLTTYVETLPPWAADYLEAAVGLPTGCLGSACHPITKDRFKIPSFRCMWKVHKAYADTRPVHSNHVWILQPLSDVIDALVLGHVKKTPNFTRDADDAILAVDAATVATDDVLVSFDWVNLYPSIDHDVLLRLLRRFLVRVGSTQSHVDFLCAAVALLLEQNYCIFDGIVRRQTTGFATGASAGASLAHIFLYELTRETFAAFDDNVRLLKCYIDDGLLVWRGPLDRLEDLFAALDSLTPGMRVTHEVSLFTAVFLDCRFFKGPIWTAHRRLDVCLYSKPVNGYLYKTFDSAAPLSQYKGVVLGELIRYIKRSSCPLAYMALSRLFYLRLRDRGYPPRFLREAFGSAPSWFARPRLLSHATQQPDSGRLRALVMPYSRELERTNLARVLHAHDALLPSHLVGDKSLVAGWRGYVHIYQICFAFPPPC